MILDIEVREFCLTFLKKRTLYIRLPSVFIENDRHLRINFSSSQTLMRYENYFSNFSCKVHFSKSWKYMTELFETFSASQCNTDISKLTLKFWYNELWCGSFHVTDPRVPLLRSADHIARTLYYLNEVYERI